MPKDTSRDLKNEDLPADHEPACWHGHAHITWYCNSPYWKSFDSGSVNCARTVLRTVLCIDSGAGTLSWYVCVCMCFCMCVLCVCVSVFLLGFQIQVANAWVYVCMYVLAMSICMYWFLYVSTYYNMCAVDKKHLIFHSCCSISVSTKTMPPRKVKLLPGQCTITCLIASLTPDVRSFLLECYYYTLL